MTTRLSPRLAEIVAALPIRPHLRVLEIGPGAAARAIGDTLTTGHILAIDRSATAIEHLKACSSDQIAAGPPERAPRGHRGLHPAQ